MSLAKSLFNFITVSEQGIGRHALTKSNWTLDVGSMLGVVSSSAGAGTVGHPDGRDVPSADGKNAGAGASNSE